MLLEVTVKNFLSIKNEQTLSLLASTDDTLVESNTMKPFSDAPRLVRSAVIFGANAAGKSNFIKAIKFASDFILDGRNVGEEIGKNSFLLDLSTRDEASEFEFIFVFNGVRYQYGFSVTSNEVVSEWLFEAPEGRLRELFQRNKQEFKFGTSLKGQKKLIEGSTRENMLFLTTGAQLNNEHLRKVYNWFFENIFFTKRHDKNSLELSRYTVEKSTDDIYKDRVISFLKAADVGIDNFFINDESEEELGELNDNEDEQSLSPLFLHPIKGSEYFAGFDFGMESDGTQNIFALSGLWLDVLDSGGILFIDEIEGSLHPYLVEFLIKVFLNKNTNKLGAQLVFTTHETTVMKKGLLRRDQIWFVEKDKDLATSLFPLSDFSPRKGEAIQKAYLLGKFGAVPYVGKKFNG